MCKLYPSILSRLGPNNRTDVELTHLGGRHPYRDTDLVLSINRGEKDCKLRSFFNPHSLDEINKELEG